MGKRTHGPYLIAAIEYGDIEKVSHILTTKFRDKSKVKTFLVSEVRRLASDHVEVPLLQAATLADPTIIRYFVTKHDANINFLYEYGSQNHRRCKTALLVAIRRGLYATVDAILQLNADVNVQDHKGRTPLHHAVRRADYRMAKLLLARGAQTGYADIAGNTPLHIASIFGHAEMCKLLLRNGADLYKKGQHGALAIHIAAREGHASLVRMFVTLYETTVDIKVPCYDEREQAPIHVAASEGHYETVYTLLEACGSDVNVRDSEGETALHCAVIQEYDPLGMKSKDDFTETVKVLLNFGAEANLRNARGETPLHLAARNEFQKVVEVLVLAGCDPLIEDNDKNKPLDLVSPEDTVSRQTLKTAMTDRERIMNEAREVRAKGFGTSLQRELPLSIRSQSAMNLPLAGMHGTLAANRYLSHTGLYHPPSHGMTMASNNSAYMPGPMGMPQYANNSGSRTTSSSTNSSKRRSEYGTGGPRLPPSMFNTSTGALAPAHDRPVAAIRKTKSVEELDQPQRRDRSRRPRKGSYQESEASSFWAVTPPGSVRDEMDLEVDVPSPRGKKSGRGKTNKKQKFRLNESDEELLEDDELGKKQGKKSRQTAPVKFVPPQKKVDTRYEELNESEEYFLDDDDASTVDMLDVEVRAPPPSKKRDKAAPPATSKKATQPTGKQPGKGPGMVQSWLDEQARILKERNKSEAVGPVAHSTPPATARRTKNAPPPAAESSETSSCSSDSSDTDAPKGPPPPPPVTKPKPKPPPKPVKEGKPGSTGGKPTGQRQPLFLMENPNSDKVVQLEVDETQPSAQTVISVIPINPPGPSRTETIPHGHGSSTFVSLQKNFSAPPDDSTSKPNKPTTSKTSKTKKKKVPTATLR